MSKDHQPETVVENVRRRIAGKNDLRKQDVRNMIRHALIYARVTPREDLIDTLTAEVLDDRPQSSGQIAV